MSLTPGSGLVQYAWMAVILLPVLIILGEFFFGTHGDDSSVDAETRTRAGLAFVRIAWAAAILVPVLIIVGVLLSRGDNGDSSRQSSHVASAPPTAPPAGAEASRANAVARHNHHSHPAAVHANGGGQPSSGVTPPSESQPGSTGESTPVVNPQPSPSPAPRPKPTPAPRPKPTPAPPQAPAPTPPPVSQTPSEPAPTPIPSIIANNNNGP